MTKLIAIVGPTATGKTDLAIELAGRFNGEIVCADSRTVYRGMDVGTAKPTPEQQRQVPHHLIDVINPDESMSAAEFKSLAQIAIEQIAARGKVPFLVGGTGLYVDAVLFDYKFPSENAHHSMVQLDGMSDHELRELLAAEDPEVVKSIDLNNRRRVIRAIETAGQPRSKAEHLRAETLVLGLRTSKEVAQQRITQRAEKLLPKGILDEVRELGTTYGWGSEAMTGIAYRAFSGVVLGAKSVEQATADCVRGELGLWKRQMTWFRRNPYVTWLDVPGEAEPLVAEFLSARV